MSPETQTQSQSAPVVRITRDGAVATLALERPQGRNSFDVATLDEMLGAMRQLVDDPAVRAVVLTGTERAFCAGGDVAEMAANKERAPAHFDDLTSRYHTMISLMSHADKTFVTALRGIAAGGGVGYALAADLVVAADDSRLVLAYGNLGVSPDGGTTAALVRAIGPHRAREAIIIDDGITADQMLEWGLANRVVPDGEVVALATELARKASTRARHTVRETKRLIEQAAHQPFAEMLDAEREAIIRAAAGADFAEGLDAFANKRKPTFA